MSSAAVVAVACSGMSGERLLYPRPQFAFHRLVVARDIYHQSTRFPVASHDSHQQLDVVRATVGRHDVGHFDLSGVLLRDRG
jgi:hypothetical protein